MVRQIPRSIVDRVRQNMSYLENVRSYRCDASPPPPPLPSPCLLLQPENAIRVKKFSLEDDSDPTQDTVLYDLAPFLTALATQASWKTCFEVRPCNNWEWIKFRLEVAIGQRMKIVRVETLVFTAPQRLYRYVWIPTELTSFLSGKQRVF